MEKAENEKPLFRTCVWFNSGRQNLQKSVETWQQRPPKSSAYGTQGRKNGGLNVANMEPKTSQNGGGPMGYPPPSGSRWRKRNKKQERNKKEGCFPQRPPLLAEIWPQLSFQNGAKMAKNSMQTSVFFLMHLGNYFFCEF